MTTCPICNEKFKQLHGSHLKKHGISTRELKILYPHVSFRNEASYTSRQDKLKQTELLHPILCKQCNSPILGKNRNKKSFCNQSCATTFNNTERHKHKSYVASSCHYCNKEYQVLKYRSKISKFCTSTCAAASTRKKRIEINCSQCNTVYKISERNLNKAVHHFCNNKCKHLFYIQNPNIRGIFKKHNGVSAVSTYRNLAFNTYEHKCYYCGYNQFEDVLQVHHVDENRKNNSIQNLRIVCPTCHSEVHKGYK